CSTRHNETFTLQTKRAGGFAGVPPGLPALVTLAGACRHARAVVGRPSVCPRVSRAPVFAGSPVVAEGPDRGCEADAIDVGSRLPGTRGRPSTHRWIYTTRLGGWPGSLALPGWDLSACRRMADSGVGLAVDRVFGVHDP